MNRAMKLLLGKIGRFSAAHPWSHNEAYSPWIIRQAREVRRRGGERALDVGCGTGRLLKSLSGVMPEVVGIESDALTAARAQDTLAGVHNATVRVERFPSATLGEANFDLVTFVAALHHLPLARTLEAARRLLRPGGRLVIVGLAREAPADLPLSVTSTLLNPVIGLMRHPQRAQATPESMAAPTAEPSETFEQIASTAREMLPGVKMRRGLFWRYTAVWVKDVA